MFFATFSVFCGLVLALCDAQAACPSCDVAQNWTQVRIPEPMLLEDFEQYVVGVEMAELYYAFQNPKPYEPYYNYKILLSMLTPDIFLEQVEADELGLDSVSTPQCIRSDLTLQLMPLMEGETMPKARFVLPELDDLVVKYYWTSCPEKYIWIFKCTGPNGGYCPKSGIELGLAVPLRTPTFTSLENLPWVSMLTDLRQTSRIIFGTDDLYWSWTFGDSIYCN